MQQETLRIFVYDTLMYGLDAHKVFCVSDEQRGELLRVEPASISVGRLVRHNTSCGPMDYVVIDKDTIGRDLYIGDICTQFTYDLKCAELLNRPSEKGEATVYGEILTFTGTKEQLQTRLCYLDAYKGFRRPVINVNDNELGDSYYWRVMVNATTTDDETYPVWIWIQNPIRAEQK